MSEIEQSSGCGYEGSHFGAPYPDACCIDGYLWDLDSCDEPGGSLYRGGDVACPCCNTREYVEDGMQGNGIPAANGNSRQRRKHVRALIRKVKRWVN
jgi:hypothetical protein